MLDSAYTWEHAAHGHTWCRHAVISCDSVGLTTQMKSKRLGWAKTNMDHLNYFSYQQLTFPRSVMSVGRSQSARVESRQYKQRRQYTTRNASYTRHWDRVVHYCFQDAEISTIRPQETGDFGDEFFINPHSWEIGCATTYDSQLVTVGTATKLEHKSWMFDR